MIFSIHNNNGDLYLNSNFINDGSTSPSSGTTFFKSVTNPLMSISGSSNEVNFYDLEIHITAPNTKGVSVADNFALNVANSINFVNGDIRLVGEAQLIQSHSGVNGNTVSSGKILIDQQGYASAYKFDYWSSPVNNGGTFSLLGGKYDGTDSNINSFSPQQILFNSGSPYNGIPSDVDVGNNVTTPLTINTQWLYQYMQGTGAYTDWVSLDENSALAPGVGYTMKGTNTTSEEQNYVFYGEPNNGEYLFSINAGEQSLLGNPYPSALDSDKFLNDNLAILDALYFWVDGGTTSHVLVSYLGGYAIRNLTGGVTPSIASPLISGLGTSGSVTAPTQYIAVGKGFIIDANESGNIVFDNSQRVFKTESSVDSDFSRMPSNSDFNADKQYIRIGYEDPEGFHRQLLLGFLPSTPANLDYNAGYDAFLNEYREDDLFFIIQGDLDKKYVIQGLGGFNENLELPLGLIIAEQGTHRIMLDALENFTDTIYLKDSFLNITYDLNASNHYFNLQPGEYLDRFSIVFQPLETLSMGIGDLLDKVDIYHNGDNHIVVENIEGVDIKTIRVFNTLGQEVLELNIKNKNENRMLVPFNCSDGVYVVQLEIDNNTLNRKIITH